MPQNNNYILGRETLEASSETAQSSKKEAEQRKTLHQTEGSTVEENTRESRRNPKESSMTEGGNAQAHLRSSKEQEIIIAVRPDLLRQLKQEESEAPVSPMTRPSLSTLADSVSSRCSSRCVTPHSIVSGPMKDMGEERRKKIKRKTLEIRCSLKPCHTFNYQPGVFSYFLGLSQIQTS